MKNSTSSPVVSPGHIVGGGHYSLHVPLGESGLLWLAQDEEQQRLAAIRFLSAEIRQDARTLETLKKRVQAASNVQHENVCRILEWYESPGVETFIATEYVEGKSLVDAMNGSGGQPIPWDWLMPAAASVACGLEALHLAGAVHHGVMPENIMVGSDKRVKLLNTVVTGALKNPLLAPSVLNDAAALRCFSPQQLGGADPSPSDDFYSLGATLFELLTGTPVFGDTNSLLQDIQSLPAPSLRERLRERQVSHAVPDAVVDFVNACLRKDEGQRPKTFQVILPRRAEAIPVSAPKEERAQRVEKVVPVQVEPDTAEFLPVPVRSDFELVRRARDARSRSKAPLAIAAALAVIAGGAGAWFFAVEQKKGAQRIAEVAAKEAREREVAEQKKLEAERKLRAETEARLKSEAEARKAQSTLVAVTEEKRRAEAEAKARQERDAIAKAAEQQPKRPGPPPLPSTTTNGFVSMFNGKDLTDWSGDSQYWSVKEGCITAQAQSDDPKERYLLVWQKGTVTDFEMHFSYRFRLLRGNRTPNGGVNYRLSGETNLTCYQFDLVTNLKDLGAVSDDKKRYRLAGYGESALAAEKGPKSELLEQLGDTNKINGIKPEDWNKCVIIAKGNRLTHYVNGILVADLTDEAKSKRHMQGLITLELYTRNTNNCATFLQFSDLKLKKLTGNGGLASAGRPGSNP
jgi:hypothetical protein